MRNDISLPRRIRYWLEYALVRFGFWLFRTIGRNRSSNFGGWLARKIGPCLSSHQTALENIKMALPNLSEKDRSVVLGQMWENLGRNAAEIPFVSNFEISDTDVVMVGQEHLDSFMQSGRAALFVSGHYGPWEAMALAGKYCEVDMTVVYRAANNPMVDAYFQKERQDVGFNFVPKGKSGARAIIRALHSNEPVALLNDQKQNSGVPIPFFGRDAMTATAVADFACRLNLPVYPLRTERREDGRIQITIYPPLFAPSGGHTKENVVSFLTTINEVYESWIRERPDHWFWVHNRW